MSRGGINAYVYLIAVINEAYSSLSGNYLHTRFKGKESLSKQCLTLLHTLCPTVNCIFSRT